MKELATNWKKKNGEEQKFSHFLSIDLPELKKMLERFEI
jgi:hypothetical protein